MSWFFVTLIFCRQGWPSASWGSMWTGRACVPLAGATHMVHLSQASLPQSPCKRSSCLPQRDRGHASLRIQASAPSALAGCCLTPPSSLVGCLCLGSSGFLSPRFLSSAWPSLHLSPSCLHSPSLVGISGLPSLIFNLISSLSFHVGLGRGGGKHVSALFREGLLHLALYFVM